MLTPLDQQMANERKVAGWLQEEIGRPPLFIGALGDPKPEQASKPLNINATSLTTMIPHSPVDVHLMALSTPLCIIRLC